jgi:sorting nexin-1/2
MGQTFCHIGKTADRASSLSSAYHELLTNHFLEPLRDHLKVIQAAKVALSKRNNRLVTYSTCLNAVDAKRATLHKYRIAMDKSNIVGAEASLGRAEQSVLVARKNYEEVSVRVLREMDRFRREYAVEMYATMTEFIKAQKWYYDGMNEVWGSLLPQVEGHSVLSASDGYLFSREAAHIVPMPMYPPPAEPSSNGSSSTNIHAGLVDSSTSNGVVRYRELPDLHEE